MKKYIKILIWSIVIANLCFAPASEINKVHINIPHFDKIVHFGMFFILALLIAGLNGKYATYFNRILLPVIAIVYGGLIELIQLWFISGRDGDWFDWIADNAGVVLGLMVFSFLPFQLKKLLS